MKSTIFSVLIEDHDRHRTLLKKICKTSGASAERVMLLEELTHEIKGHAAAEEQALWSTVLRKPAITEDGRHAVAEHYELDKLLNDLAATDMASSVWLTKMKNLRDEYLHHIDEEEKEIFIAVEKELNEDDKKYMAEVFERRKIAESKKAEVTPKKLEDHKH
jgi:hemerythrin-like domain-containing protein